MPRAAIGPIAMSELLRRVVEVAVDTGMVTTATLNTLTDATKNWPDNQWKDYVVEIVSGTGEGQIRKIVSNTSSTLVVDPPWTTVPDTTSRYAIRFVGVGAMSLSAWGGVALTGRDVTQDLQKLQNLDVLLSSRASEATLASIDGKVATESTLGAIKSKTDNLDVLLSTRAPKDEGETITICTNADISGGVTASLKNFKRWTLYLKVAAAMDITIEPVSYTHLTLPTICSV